jgi:NADH-quinone oxidoreductase subunit E
VSAQELFSDAELKTVEEITSRYVERASAVMPLLHYVQEVRGYLGEEELAYIADYLEIPRVRAYEVATYYTMYSVKPRGKHVIQVCRNLSCTLGGAEGIVEFLKKELDVEVGGTTADGVFSLVEVECIGACDKAPAIMIDGDHHGPVTPESLRGILDAYRVKS